MSGFLNPQARNVRSHCRFFDGVFQGLPSEVFLGTMKK
jgi:hypothetical protein